MTQQISISFSFSETELNPIYWLFNYVISSGSKLVQGQIHKFLMGRLGEFASAETKKHEEIRFVHFLDNVKVVFFFQQ